MERLIYVVVGLIASIIASVIICRTCGGVVSEHWYYTFTFFVVFGISVGCFMPIDSPTPDCDEYGCQFIDENSDCAIGMNSVNCKYYPTGGVTIDTVE